MSHQPKTIGTKEEAKHALVPKLRFPEFRGAEGWKDIPIASILKIRDKRRVPTAEAPLFSLTIESGITEKTDRYNREFLVRDAGNKKYKLVEPNDIVYNPSNLRWGAINYSQLSHSVVVSPIYEVLSLGDDSEHFLEFIACAVMRDEQIRRFITKAQGTLVERIAVKIEDFVSTKLPVPPTRAEQQKIAECLSSVDELMAAQARKVDALKTHKKGLMQQLFPRRNENSEVRSEKTEPNSSFSIPNSNFSIPSLRFPEFQNAGAWVQKTVGDVSEVLMCKRIFAEETNPSEGVPFYKIGTLGGIPDAFICREKFEDYKSRYNYPRTGEVLITCSGTVGKCLPFDGKDAYFQDSNIVWLDNPTGEVSNQFLLMLLLNVNWGSLNSTTITRIYGPDLRGMAIKYPEDEAEQQRIATCLSSLDALITAETQKHEALKTHKKGLMQQLFPSPEELS